MNATISEFLKYIKYEKNYSDNTVETYRIALTEYEDFVVSTIGELDWSKPDLNLVRRWMVFMGQKRHYAITNVKLHLSALRSIYKYLRRQGVVSTDPLALMPSPQVPKPLPVWVRESDMDEIIDSSEFGDDFEGIRDRLFIDMLYSTGMRKAEIIGLRDQDIDFSNRTLRVTGKGNKQRMIPFGQELNDLMRGYIELRNREVGTTEFFFAKPDGGAISSAKAYAIASKYLSQIPNLQKHGTHVLRHSFATNMLQEGADLMAVKELLGHSSLNSTEVYTHLTPQELIQNYRRAHPRSNDSKKC